MANLVEQYQQIADKARQANEKREAEIRGILDEIIQRYQPGGSFLTGAKGELEQRKVKDVGGSMQQMISSGLFGTTGAAGLGRRWEAEVGEPGRARLEDISAERLSAAQRDKAGFAERIEEPYPDMSALGAASQAQGAGSGSVGRSGGRGGGPAAMGLYGARAREAALSVAGGGAVSGGAVMPTTSPQQTTAPSAAAPSQSSTSGKRNLQGGIIRSGYYYPKARR